MFAAVAAADGQTVGGWRHGILFRFFDEIRSLGRFYSVLTCAAFPRWEPGQQFQTIKREIPGKVFLH